MLPRPLCFLSTFYFLLSTFTPLTPTHAAESPPPPIQISGDVLDPTGKPLPNATVIIPSDSDAGIRGTLAATRTDSAGKFSFENIDTAKAESDLIALIPGVGISQPARLFASPIRLQLVPSYDVQLTMLQEDGTPAQNVEMHITFILFLPDGNDWGNSIFMSEEKPHVITAVTDAQGKCIFHGMPQGATLRFDTNDPRFARLWGGGQMPLQGDGPLVIAKPLRLTKATSLSGRLLTQTGQPEPGRIVSANSAESSLQNSFGLAVTDANGQYTINQLKQGLYLVSLRDRKDGPTEWVAPPTTATATPDKPATLDLTLTHGGFIKGQGRDTLTGKPLEGLDIGLYADTPYRSAIIYYSRVTDKDGNYEFRVPPGIHNVYMMGQVPDGYLQPANQGKKTISVTESQTGEVNFDIQPDPAPIIEGTVVGPDGNPLSKATITIANPNNREFVAFDRYVSSDDQGHFRLHAQPGYQLRVTSNDLSTKAPIQILDERPLEIKLSKEAKFTIVVQLTDPEGKPAVNATAMLITSRGFGGSGGQPRKADAHGIVRFGPLPTDGKYSVQAGGEDYGELQERVDISTLDNDKNELLLPMTLPVATAEIAGIVVNEENKPLPQIAVTLRSDRGTERETRTDAQGHFSFHVVEGASAQIYLDRNGSRSTSPPARAKAGQTDLNLMLPKSAR